ncbi:MBL fold metallo-hydrolase [Kribbella hippodromi]|uniref:MBL fold metallo-hydrolase n=1 Tax=Kribbella hippodromi TaxID=434347 RepID=A0ABP4PX89_9ACTN
MSRQPTHREHPGLPAPSSLVQFEAWRAYQLPPVEQVREGVWSVPLPLPPGNPMTYVNCYALAAPQGVTVVDPGWDHEEGWLALKSGLSTLGAAVDDVTHVLVTHFHPDHFGLAPRLRATAHARVLMHAADAGVIAPDHRSIDETLQVIAEFLRSCGTPAAEITDLLHERALIERLRTASGPDGYLAAGEVLTVGGHDVMAVWTPGHTRGHLCFYLRKEELLLTGDHVLPRISPNVSVYDHSPASPLDDFLVSLEMLRRLPVSEVLPAHEYRFSGLGARLDELIKHHDQRLDQVLDLLRGGGAATSWDLAARMGWSRTWEQMAGYTRRSANGEILAHLVVLERRGLAVRTAGTPQLWTAASR